MKTLCCFLLLLGFAADPAAATLQVTTKSLPDGTVNKSYEATLAATGGTGPTYQWFPGSKGGLPPGLMLDKTGVISGTPMTPGVFAFMVDVANGGQTAFANLTITINSAATGPTLSYPALALPIFTTTNLFLAPTSSTGWAGFRLANGSLPAGLTLNPATGVISGTPTEFGTFTAAIQGTTTGGQTATTSETLTILLPVCDCDDTVKIVSSAGADEDVGVNTATGGTQGAMLDLDLGGGPLRVVLTRFNNAQLSQGGSSTISAAFSGALGPNWMHGFEANLRVSGAAAMVTLPGGKKVQFSQGTGSAWVLQGPEQFTFQLVTTDNGYQFLDPRTKAILDFSSGGALTGIEDQNGNTLTVTPGPNGPTNVSDGLGRSLDFSYNASGQLIEVSDQTRRSVQFGYTGTNLTTFTDANGGVTTYTYTAAGSLLTAETRPVGNTPATIAYNAQSQVQTNTDSFKNVTSFAYRLNGGQTTITDARGNNEIDAYQDFFALTDQTDALNHTRSFAYDSNFRQTSFTDRLGNTSTAEYLAGAGYPASLTDAQGHTTSFSYAAQIQGLFTFYNLSTIRFADGTSVSFIYDRRGNVLTSTDQAGNVTTFTYNSRGQVLTVTNAAGGETTFTYNSDGTPATSTDPSGNTTTYAYDNLKRLIKATFANGASVSTAYDPLNRISTSTDERRNLTALGYNANSDGTSVTDPLNHRATAAFDTDDRVTSTTDPLGNTTTFAYNPVSAVESVTNAAGEKTTNTYDALNRVSSIADQAGFGPSFSYDHEGHLTGITDALSNTSTFVYDRLGHVIQTTTPLGETYKETFDAVGRVISATNPLGQTTNYSYDSRGLTTNITAPLGISVSFARDKLGLLSSLKDPNGNNWTLQHDATGRVTSKMDPLGRTLSYTYDQRNRLETMSAAPGSAQWTYDAAGNPAQIQYTDGTTKNYTFDADNRLIAANGVALGYDAAGRLVSSNGVVNTRDAIGRIASITYAPGKTVNYTYNGRGLLEHISDWAGGSVTLTYDKAGRLISMARSNGVATQYSYDQDSQTSAITESSSSQTLASIALQRDAAGKVTSATREVPQAPNEAPGVIGFSYDAAEQVSGDSYDGLGRVIKDASQTYTWDLASELMSRSGANGSASFTYDGFGMRTSSTAGGATESYVWNYALGLPSIATVRSGAADRRYYLYLPGGALLCAIDASGNEHHWYHFDEMGTTTMLTNDSGQVTDSYGITPYGETVSATGSTPNPFTWLGEWGVMQEGSTGLYYMRARYYDSTSAHFLSRDPVQRTNPYQYASNNPLSFVDPTGTDDLDVAAIGRFVGSVLLYCAKAKELTAEEIELVIGSRVLAYAVKAQADAENIWDLGGGFVNWWVQQTIAIHSEDETFRGAVAPWLFSQESFVSWYLARALTTISDLPGLRTLQAAFNAASTAAKYLKAAGTAVIVAATVVQTAVGIAQDIHKGFPWWVTAADAGGNLGAGLLTLRFPWLGAADLVTGGSATGILHNGVEAAILLQASPLVTGRVNSQAQDAIKQTLTSTPGTALLYGAGEWGANQPAAQPVINALATGLGYAESAASWIGGLVRGK